MKVNPSGVQSEPVSPDEIPTVSPFDDDDDGGITEEERDEFAKQRELIWAKERLKQERAEAAANARRRNIPVNPRGKETEKVFDDDITTSFVDDDGMVLEWPEVVQRLKKHCNVAYQRLMTQFRDADVVRELERCIAARGYPPDDPFYVVVELLSITDARQLASTQLFGEIGKTVQELTVFVIDEMAKLHPLLKDSSRSLLKMQELASRVRKHEESLSHFEQVAPRLLADMEGVVAESREKNWISMVFQTVGILLAGTFGMLIGAHVTGSRVIGVTFLEIVACIGVGAATFFGGWFLRGRRN